LRKRENDLEETDMVKKEEKSKLESFLEKNFVDEKFFHEELKKKRPDLFLAKRKDDAEVLLARHLVVRRLELQMTQAEVSKRASIGFVTYQRMEMAKKDSNPTLKNIERVAKALSVQMADLLCTR
jgi:DNA-binding Xre family transcriptional regulator